MYNNGSERAEEQERINLLLQTIDLSSAVITEVKGYFYRTVRYCYSSEPLSTKGAEKAGGRYNFKPAQRNSFPCFYCADHEDTATTESFYGLRINGDPRSPHTTFAVYVNLSRMLDLSTENYCTRAGVNWKAISEPWLYAQDVLAIASYTQRISMIAYEDGGIEGIIYTSTKREGATCLAIYKERMLSNSYLELHDPRGELKIPEQNKTWRGLSGFSE